VRHRQELRHGLAHRGATLGAQWDAAVHHRLLSSEQQVWSLGIWQLPQRRSWDAR
jgi:hypothetical protein